MKGNLSSAAQLGLWEEFFKGSCPSPRTASGASRPTPLSGLNHLGTGSSSKAAGIKRRVWNVSREITSRSADWQNTLLIISNFSAKKPTNSYIFLMVRKAVFLVMYWQQSEYLSDAGRFTYTTYKINCWNNQRINHKFKYQLVFANN